MIQLFRYIRLTKANASYNLFKVTYQWCPSTELPRRWFPWGWRGCLFSCPLSCSSPRFHHRRCLPPCNTIPSYEHLTNQTTCSSLHNFLTTNQKVCQFLLIINSVQSSSTATCKFVTTNQEVCQFLLIINSAKSSSTIFQSILIGSLKILMLNFFICTRCYIKCYTYVVVSCVYILFHTDKAKNQSKRQIDD